MVDNSAFSPTGLTAREIRLILASEASSPFSPFQVVRFVMGFHVFLFQLVVYLLFCLALLWRLCWLPLRPSHSRGGPIRSTAQRLLKPRTPLDCPACRFSCAHASSGGPTPA